MMDSNIEVIEFFNKEIEFDKLDKFCVFYLT